jgi:hypothetical protein
MSHIVPQALITELTNSMRTGAISAKPQIKFLVIIQFTIMMEQINNLGNSMFIYRPCA